MTNFNFQVLVCSGVAPPGVSFHSCSLIRNKFYIFGGVDNDKNVHNRMFCFEPSRNHWSPVVPSCMKTDPKTSLFNGVHVKEPPRLSHHTATVLNDQYILFIGGWTGHKRTSEVFHFDTLENTWFQVQVKGDIPVGLSSHTATLVSEHDIIIVGREGGVRTQRRSGDAFYFNVKTGVYKETMMHVSSRSGHTANLIKPSPARRTQGMYKLFVQGGRKGSEYEMIGSWREKPKLGEGLEKGKLDLLMTGLVGCAEPKGRQHCTAVELSDRYLLFFGGETWSGVRNNVTNELYIFDCQKIKWYCQPCLGHGAPCLTGHAMSILQDKVYVFGGLVEGKCTNNVWMLQL